MSNFYRIIPGPKVGGGSGPPLASDVNQFAKALNGEIDVGAISFAGAVSAPASPGVATATSGAGLDVGVYTYAVTYVTGHLRDDGTFVEGGETTASATWTATTTSGNQRVSHSSLPVPSSLLVVKKRLYRTVAGGAQRKLVATLDANVTSYVDSVADVALGANVPTTNTTGTRLSGTILSDALVAQIDTRSTTLAYSGGRLSTITETSGGSTVRTITLGYDGGGKLTTVTEVVAGKTITTTLTYTSGSLTGVSRSVT